MEFIHSMNLGLYKMGILMFLVTVALMINYQLRYIRQASSKKEQERDYFPIGLIIFLAILLIALKAYIFLLVAILLISFYLIVLNNKKYKDIKAKFDEFF